MTIVSIVTSVSVTQSQKFWSTISLQLRALFQIIESIIMNEQSEGDNHDLNASPPRKKSRIRNCTLIMIG